MNNKIIILALAATTLFSCGGQKEEKTEEVKTDTTAKEEAKPEIHYSYKIEEVDVVPQWAVTIGDSTKVDELQTFFSTNFPKLGKLGNFKKEDFFSPPLALYYDFSMDKKFYTVAAMYVKDSTRKVKAPAKLEKLYGGKALKVEYFGAYENMTTAYDEMMMYMEEKGLRPAGPNWEHYISDPMLEKDTTKWQTDIYFPVQPK